ncbi:MAG: class I SAM-dependent rRNA methyltransferase [Gallionella sp.]|nr:class I SAM-dependent rRNA methyltransferase [Gallionella sp.]
MTNPKTKSPSTPHRPSQGNRDFRNRTKRNGKSSEAQNDAPRHVLQHPRGNINSPAAIILNPGREKSVLHRHPWIFSGAIKQMDGAPISRDTLPVRSAQGEFLAWAAYNPDSKITARIWSWREDEIIDAAFFRKRIESALAARVSFSNISQEKKWPAFPLPQGEGLKVEGTHINDSSLTPTLSRREREATQNNGMRLIHAESDGLPGLIVDQYGDVLVMQIGSAGAERWRDTCADILQELCNPICVYERSDSDSRLLEKLDKRNGVLRGSLPNSVEVIENGLRFKVDVAEGQKTGFYLDQRNNRALTETLARDKDVLNCFCYTGGFSLYALRGGAKSVLSIDASADALSIAQENLIANGLDTTRAEWQEADVFQALRTLRDQGRKFDLIILDPPKFAPTAAFAEKAARGYKDINLLGFKLLRPGGVLATYSCSGGISDDLFQKIIAGAALDAGVDAQIVHYLHASADHPVLLSFPEGAYLKGLVLRIST